MNRMRKQRLTRARLAEDEQRNVRLRRERRELETARHFLIHRGHALELEMRKRFHDRGGRSKTECRHCKRTSEKFTLSVLFRSARNGGRIHRTKASKNP